jgi:hypothetical protein
MKRSKLFLAVAATLVAACETPTAPSARRLDADRPALDASSTSATTFSGEATVVRASVTPGIGEPITVNLVETGKLPESGGALSATLLKLEISKAQTGGILGLDATVGHASTVGQGKRSHSQATVADVALEVAGQPIRATALEAAASAVCDAVGNAIGAASSAIADLTVAGQPITVTGERNQVINLPLLRIMLNEQVVTQSGNRTDVTVNALHITASDPVTGQKVDVIVAQAHADITCGICTDQGDDFTTGGGWFNTGDAPQMRKHFAVAGGYKNGAWWGHLTYMDKAEGIQVKGDEVYLYENNKTPEGNRSFIKGRGHLRDGSPVDYEVTVEDNGEPGRADRFHIALKGVPSHPAYAVGGTLGGGNVQFHDKPSRCPVN